MTIIAIYKFSMRTIKICIWQYTECPNNTSISVKNTCQLSLNKDISNNCEEYLLSCNLTGEKQKRNTVLVFPSSYMKGFAKNLSMI